MTECVTAAQFFVTALILCDMRLGSRVDANQNFPSSRDEALAKWNVFLPKLRRYAANRNRVTVDHQNVSRLSAAIRYRLIHEQELIAQSLECHEFSAIEKWLQELCWRRYWKGWLERHPHVWQDFLKNAVIARCSLQDEYQCQRADEIMQARSGVAIIDHWTRELLESGYLHNHARMWWASYWIHGEGLPWEWGAAFFYRHLLDADPASNTLSWRWVAGLHTLGKQYIVRLSNIQRYADELLQRYPDGAERLSDGAISARCFLAEKTIASPPTLIYPSHVATEHHADALWIHGCDLSPELGPLAELSPSFVLLTLPWHALPRSLVAEQWQRRALNDCRARAERHFSEASLEVADAGDPCEQMLEWAKRHQLKNVICLAPCVGELAMPVEDLVMQCGQIGVTLHCLRRAEDQLAHAHGHQGFFPFWQKQRRQLLAQFPPKQRQWDF